MPANQGQTSPDWSPRPDIRGHELDPVATQERYVPQNYEQCVRYVIECASIPDVDMYAGLSEAQRGIAEDYASKVYVPGQDVVGRLNRLLRQKEVVEPPKEDSTPQSPPSEVFVFQNRAPKKTTPTPTHYGASITPLHAVPESSPMLKRLNRSRVSA